MCVCMYITCIHLCFVIITKSCDISIYYTDKEGKSSIPIHKVSTEDKQLKGIIIIIMYNYVKPRIRELARPHLHGAKYI